MKTNKKHRKVLWNRVIMLALTPLYLVYLGWYCMVHYEMGNPANIVIALGFGIPMWIVLFMLVCYPEK